MDGDFKDRLVKKAQFVNKESCTGCGACMEACPVTLPDEMDSKIGDTRKLIHMPSSKPCPT